MGQLMIITLFGKIIFKLIKFSLIPIILLILWVHIAPEIRASETITDPSSVDQGSLLAKTKTGQYQQLPLLDTQVQIKISGLIARAKVQQFFQNQSNEFIEAVYIFPLPEDSAVDHLSMVIGERIIIGEIKEKSAARKIYRQAKKQGQKAALLEQQRANIFSSKVANIAPGEIVQINIEYQQVVHYEAGVFSLRFPTAITPRYHPVTMQLQEKFLPVSKNGWQAQPEEIISLPILPADKGAAISLSIDIELDAGIPLEVIDSPYHQIVRQKNSTGNYYLTLKNYQSSHRDFELRWQPKKSDKPRAALFTEQLQGHPDDYLLLMIMPPEADNFTVLPRELTLVIDQSGSMQGASMKQAIIALQQALDKLNAADHFNVIAFNHQMRSLFSQPVVASTTNLSQARHFVDSLTAEGGTEMLPALKKALSEPVSDGFVRQVVFLTDGAVANEDNLFSVIHTQLGEARLFTIGIGSAPNSYFMRKAAQFGRGTFTYIGKPAEVADKMQTLFQQLESPVMKNINVIWPSEVQQFPELIPDLYLGEPLMLRVKTRQLAGEVQISGEQRHMLWQAAVPLDRGHSNVSNKNELSSGVAVLWARAKISDLLDQQITEPENKAIRQQVIDVALQHHLVSTYTSLIAVEQQPVRPLNSPLISRPVVNQLPAGSRGQMFAYPATATGWKQQLLVGCLLLVLSMAFWLYSRRSSPERGSTVHHGDV